MSLNNTVRKEGYMYTRPVLAITAAAIEESKSVFSDYLNRNIISADSYDSSQWLISDGAHRPKKIRFVVDEIHFARECASLLGCSYKEYQQAMRVMVTCSLGLSVQQLQAISHKLCSFANKLERTSPPQVFDGNNHILYDFLTLLPGDTMFRNHLLDQLEDSEEQRRVSKQYGSRTLRYYRSYFQFDHLIKRFWAEDASPKERILFFPVYLWWELTAILPLRPTEYVLTPRDCLSRKDDQCFLSIRRTRLKGCRFSTEYSLEKDYEKKNYRIPGHLADAIDAYISATQDSYESDIDSLFSKGDQFRLLTDVKWPNDKHYTYANLCQCLSHFYNKIICGKYGFRIVDSKDRSFDSDEIEKTSLGDTRHIAMISLMISGQSPTICQELAGHDCLEIGANYYSNIKNFADALSYARAESLVHVDFESNQNGLLPSDSIELENGFCFSLNAIHGNYSDCSTAVDSTGKIGSCNSCRFFLQKGGKHTVSDSRADSGMSESFLLVRKAVSQVRQGLALPETIENTIMRFQAETRTYIERMALLQKTEGI